MKIVVLSPKRKWWIQNVNIPKYTITDASDKGTQMITPVWVWIKTPFESIPNYCNT